MKQLSILTFVGLLLTSCTITIPMQTNLSDQTMLLAENRNIMADYTLITNISDGYIPYVSVLKNGNETYKDSDYKYASSTAFKKLWESYFSSKFNSYAKEKMEIEITLLELELREQASTSIGFTVLTGNSKVNVDAIAKIKAVVLFHDEKYETQFDVTASDYNESQQIETNNSSYTINQNNPTQQKSQLLDNCLNRSIIQFENFLRSIILADKEK